MTRRIVVLLLGGVLFLGATACEDAVDTSSTGGTPAADSPDLTTGGEQVTVTGTVEEVVAGQAFTLTDATVEEGTATTDGDLAVISGDQDTAVAPSDRVTVTGTLHELDVADEVQELEDRFGISIDDGILSTFEGR